MAVPKNALCTGSFINAGAEGNGLPTTLDLLEYMKRLPKPTRELQFKLIDRFVGAEGRGRENYPALRGGAE